ncbi:hypothetical protein ABEF82_09200 [Acinetobacter thermotolerans]|uniref:hypothetical protein n=1 Tax=Acinetobacter thermotolerans TaxID=3151487 RepID=UPI00325BF311
MHYQYHCACCNRTVSSTETSCPDCGSHSIRSPYGFWMFCLITCLAAAIVVKVVPVYVQTHTQEVPAKDTIFSALQLETKQKAS